MFIVTNFVLGLLSVEREKSVQRQDSSILYASIGKRLGSLIVDMRQPFLQTRHVCNQIYCLVHN